MSLRDLAAKGFITQKAKQEMLKGNARRILGL